MSYDWHIYVWMGGTLFTQVMIMLTLDKISLRLKLLEARELGGSIEAFLHGAKFAFNNMEAIKKQKEEPPSPPTT